MRKQIIFLMLVFLAGCAFSRHFSATVKAKDITSVYANGDADVLINSDICITLGGAKCKK